MGSNLVIVGAGGYGRHSIDIVREINRASSHDIYNLLGVIDSDPREKDLGRLSELGVAYLGTESEWLKSGNFADYAVAIANPSVRMRVSHRIAAAGGSFATLVHPSVVRGSNLRIGTGCIVSAGVVTATNVELCEHVHINMNATIGHDVRIGSFSTLSPIAGLMGEVVLEPGVLMGASAVILRGLTVGSFSTIGAAACVTGDVEPESVMVGVPARAN